jgi:hypothetical protein
MGQSKSKTLHNPKGNDGYSTPINSAISPSISESVTHSKRAYLLLRLYRIYFSGIYLTTAKNQLKALTGTTSFNPENE